MRFQERPAERSAASFDQPYVHRNGFREYARLRKNDPEFLKYQHVDDHTGGALDLVKFDLAAAELTDLMSGIANYHLSADGKKLIYRAGSQYGVVDAVKGGKVAVLANHLLDAVRRCFGAVEGRGLRHGHRRPQPPASSSQNRRNRHRFIENRLHQ